MIPLELIDTAAIPGGNELHLLRRGDDFVIQLDRNELMNSRMGGSEEALADLALDRLGARAASAQLLIGGYGMGFTLRAALRRLGPEGQATVAELVPRIVEWARGPMAALTAGGLDDRRTRLDLRDVALLIAAGRGAYDAILLDVDNGPDGLVRADNDRIYARQGLRAAKRALTPGGVLAIWSAGPDPRFVNRLERAGYDVDEVAVRARSNGKGPRHVIWFATPADLPAR